MHVCDNVAFTLLLVHGGMFFLPRVRACAARGKTIGLSVVCCLSVSIEIGKSQHLGESMINYLWDKMV